MTALRTHNACRCCHACVYCLHLSVPPYIYAMMSFRPLVPAALDACMHALRVRFIACVQSLFPGLACGRRLQVCVALDEHSIWLDVWSSPLS